MRRFIDVVKPYLGVIVAIALIVPFGAGLVSILVFDRAGDRVADRLEESDLDAALVEAVLLVRATQCTAAGIGSGTAFATTLGGEPVLVTNRHVVDDARTVGVQRLDGGPGPRITSWQLAAGADVAVLRTEDGGALPVLLSLARDEAEVGAEVITVGFPNAMPFTTAGTVSDADDRRLDLDLRVEPGASGSPVLGSDGRVVGQVYARTNAGRGIATSLPALRQALSSLDEPVSGC